MTGRSGIVILGGGVIGLSTAYFLARMGIHSTIIERGKLGGESSWAGAGIIPPGNLAIATRPIDRLRALSVEMFPSFSSDLRTLTGIDNGYHRCGAIELVGGVTPDVIADWRNERISHELRVPEEWVPTSPALAGLSQAGYYLPDAAQVRNPWHLRALVEACRRLNVTMVESAGVCEVILENASSRSIKSELGEWPADDVLIAAGAWSDLILEPLGLSLGIHPIRGQMVLYRLPERIFEPIIMDGARYIVPRNDGRVLVGSTEEDVGFYKVTTNEAIAELRAFAERTLPCLRGAAIEKTWAGLRPGTVHGQPILGPFPGIGGLFIAAGHFRSGIQLSPATGTVMAELLANEEPSLPIEAFLPNPTPAKV
jgi:glycine oxidase